MTEEAFCVLAGNPGPMTLDGTNTWILSAPGSAEAVVVDPGPDDDQHLQAVLEAVRERGARVVQTLLTHGHADHSAAARHFAELTGAPVKALDPAHRYGGEGLADGDVIRADGIRLEVVATPGHTGDSLSFLSSGGRSLLTGDTVLGRGTTVVAHPDGRLDAYLDSLERLGELSGSARLERLLPGHGPALAQPGLVVDAYLKHRRERLEQVRQAVARGARTAHEVVAVVYADVPRSVWPAAELSVRAQLTYLGFTETA
ncbi:MBL fold metallo-hydrolase [Kineosporia sp. J2-2]|uniref:MBL fold metallo-hydrolase n=1 Tax=Kineosporia corallincola TaxID=2835133 RepID=A0ABS5T8E9_9ACTN|nr:MBL fold metallo-hydrolase [Kineosporia corallincola]MBT0767341.1 MBL fold metallo-hydrolase [Kineosporia corallincola]